MEAWLVVIIVLAGLGLLHGLLILAILAATFLPNPISQIQNHGSPERWNLEPERTLVGGASPAWYFANSERDAAVLICHGRSRSKKWMLPLIATVAKEFPVLAIDFPSHGEHRYGPTTIGLREAGTVTQGVEWLRRRGHDRVLVYGVSMGGAAAIISIGRDRPDGVAALVTDGTFDELSRVIDNITRKMMLPGYLRAAAYTIAKRVIGTEPADVRPILYAPDVDVPTLYLHGSHDPLVPPVCASTLATVTERARAELYDGLHDEPSNAEMQSLLLSFLREHAGGAAHAPA